MIQFVILLGIGIAPGADALQADGLAQVPVSDQAGALGLRLIVASQVRDHGIGVAYVRGILAEVVHGAAG